MKIYSRFTYAVTKSKSILSGGVDYKGVREIMKSCIDKLQGLPSSGGIVQVRVL